MTTAGEKKVEQVQQAIEEGGARLSDTVGKSEKTVNQAIEEGSARLSDAAGKSDKTVEQAKQATEEGRARLSGAVGKLVLASIGAVALGGETLSKVMNRMVERGEEVQEEARKRAAEFRSQRRRLMKRGKQQVDSALDAVDLPSKADFRSLEDQIGALSAKMDKLSDEKTKRTT